ncbi:MAG: sodium-translocating pyrophosphatase [Gammaproteobacteria bacterium]|nr:sodium-translocating pyrophosphatase [Gammaproteobacteria bacterium]
MEFWVPIFGGCGMLLALLIYRYILTFPNGTGKVLKIGQAIHDGAMVFIHRQYQILGLFILFISPWLYIYLGWRTAVSFLFGAFCSGLAGYIGMYTATNANVRTTMAAHDHGTASALTVAFFGGSIMGLCVASLGLIGLGTLYYYFGGDPATSHAIHGFGMGASSVALFARVGGGIFTKSADVGADLVGKLEAGIPEDDPRNPGVIADNVGDNVGDVAGMGSDIFESYCGATIASIAIASTMTPTALSFVGAQESLMFLPLALSSVGLVCSMLGIAIVKLFSAQKPEKALRFGTISAAVFFIIAAYFVISYFNISTQVWKSVVVGALGGICIGLITEYYTGGSPVKKIARSGETGAATVMITGLAIGMQSVVMPILTISTIIFLASHMVGLYGVAIAAVGMLATVGITMAIDAYGPVADNAGGIAEMGGLGKETRAITDSLDELGNTTAAIGKGFAVGAAALAALAIINAFVETVAVNKTNFVLSLNNPDVLIGLFLGGLLPFLIASITMTAVGDAAFDMINEIRRQFKEIKGLLEGTADPDTDRCVDIATKAAIRKMILPGCLAVFTPVIVGFGFNAEALGGLLGGALISCVLLALFMANAGGAWDNAKKYVEKGNLGGKGSLVHKALVVGDTVGDPFKDTSGPSMNILINVMAIVSLVIAPLL